jgi:beta-lactamase superfamily II metal-dependent hydrolase
MRRLSDAGATILRTDQLGTIILRTDGRAIAVEAGGHRWTVRPPAEPLPEGP